MPFLEASLWQTQGTTGGRRRREGGGEGVGKHGIENSGEAEVEIPEISDVITQTRCWMAYEFR